MFLGYLKKRNGFNLNSTGYPEIVKDRTPWDMRPWRKIRVTNRLSEGPLARFPLRYESERGAGKSEKTFPRGHLIISRLVN